MNSVKPILLLLGLFVAGVKTGYGQICMNNTDSVYGLNSISAGGSGQIVSVNIHNAGTTNVGLPPASSANANGLAFSSLSSTFYFFNQCGSGTTEFISYNPLTGSKVPLAIPSAPAIPVAQKVRSGAMTADGFSYYTIYPGATTAQGFPVTGPAFYHYSVGTNAWTLITQSFKDKTGHTVNEIKNLNSGDMAFDGSGNLWIVASNASSYALYKIKAPLPVTPVANVVVDTVLPSRATPGGVSITGIAFNSAGNLFLSTGSYTTPPGVAGNNQLYLMSDPALPLTTVGTLPNGYGDDLTSCAIPYYVLAEEKFSFDVVQHAGSVSINWQNKDEVGLKEYELEYSRDGSDWSVLTTVAPLKGGYDYEHKGCHSGYNFYRLRMDYVSGQIKYSDIRELVIKAGTSLFFGPNPATGNTRLLSDEATGCYSVELMDQAGRIVRNWPTVSSGGTIDLNGLTPGLYIARIRERRKSTEPKIIRIVKQ